MKDNQHFPAGDESLPPICGYAKSCEKYIKIHKKLWQIVQMGDFLKNQNFS